MNCQNLFLIQLFAYLGNYLFVVEQVENIDYSSYLGS